MTLGLDAQLAQLATTINVVVNSDGVFDTDPLAQALGEQIASLTMTGGTVNLENGSTLTTPTVTLTPDANAFPALIEGAGTLTRTPASSSRRIHAGTAFPDAIISAVIHASALTTKGAGTLRSLPTATPSSARVSRRAPCWPTMPAAAAPR